MRKVKKLHRRVAYLRGKVDRDTELISLMAGQIAQKTAYHLSLYMGLVNDAVSVQQPPKPKGRRTYPEDRPAQGDSGPEGAGDSQP